jgi:pyruvate/2-oxoglutarate dehydrogenase complex dihydrolipoamide acyltransferase (E2) component
MIKDYQVPKLGQSATDAEIMEWLVQVGDRVEPETPIVEVETDKLQISLPADVAGTIAEIIAAKGHVALIGEAICRIDVDD